MCSGEFFSVNDSSILKPVKALSAEVFGFIFPVDMLTPINGRHIAPAFVATPRAHD
jgi:hypothetical protein